VADIVADGDRAHARAVERRYLIRFEEDTLRQRPLWIRVIIEFLGTFVLVTVAAGSGMINQYVGDGPISRTAAVIAPGAAVMAMIYAWGPLAGLHINPAVTSAFSARGGFPTGWVVPYLALNPAARDRVVNSATTWSRPRPTGPAISTSSGHGGNLTLG
jgi:aquaporin Z